MSVLLLITTQEVKDMTSISGNTDDAKLRAHMQAAMDIYITPAIGENCMIALLDSVENDDGTALETVLLDGNNREFQGLKMALAWWIAWLAYPDLWIINSNTGLQKPTAENREALTPEEFEKKRKGVEDMAVHYTNYLIKYIQLHSDDYTCYSCEGLTALIDDNDSTGIATDYNCISTVSEAQEILNRENG